MIYTFKVMEACPSQSALTELLCVVLCIHPHLSYLPAVPPGWNNFPHLAILEISCSFFKLPSMPHVLWEGSSDAILCTQKITITNTRAYALSKKINCAKNTYVLTIFLLPSHISILSYHAGLAENSDLRVSESPGSWGAMSASWRWRASMC